MKRVHDAAVELLPGAAVQLRERFLKGDDALVEAVGGHRVEGVAHKDDAGAKGDGVAREAVGVAAAVEVLVVRTMDLYSAQRPQAGSRGRG